MLTSLPSFFDYFILQRRVCSIFLVIALIISLGFALVGCSSQLTLPIRVLKDALSLQVELTQRSLDSSSNGDTSLVVGIDHVSVEKKEEIRLGNSKVLRVIGKSDWRLQGQKKLLSSPFELFLEPGKNGESWRLARPADSSSGSTENWITYPLSIR